EPGHRPRGRGALPGASPQPRPRGWDELPAVPGDPGAAWQGVHRVFVPLLVPGCGLLRGVCRHQRGVGARGGERHPGRARPRGPRRARGRGAVTRQAADEGQHAPRARDQRQPDEPDREERDLFRARRPHGGGRCPHRRGAERPDRVRGAAPLPGRWTRPDGAGRSQGGADRRRGARRVTPRELVVEVVRLRRGPDLLALPRYMTPGSAGMGLLADIEADLVLPPGGRQLVATGIAVAIPPGFEGQVRPRSGLALRHGLTLLNAPGTIDADYRGEVQVLLANLGSEPARIRRGDRIAQLVIAPVARASWHETDALPPTERGAGGVGSMEGVVA